MTKSEFLKKYPEGKKFNVLGKTYTLHYDAEECTDNDANGLCEYYSNEIIIVDPDEPFRSKNSYKNIDQWFKKVIRHELVHAFLYEMGLEKYASDEILVNALAIKMPELSELMKQVI